MQWRREGTHWPDSTGATTALQRTPLATDSLPEAYQLWVGILTEDNLLALVAVGTAGAARPDRQFTGLKRHCVLYTDATRALYRTRAELLMQRRKEVKGAARAEKRG